MRLGRKKLPIVPDVALPEDCIGNAQVVLHPGSASYSGVDVVGYFACGAFKDGDGQEVLRRNSVYRPDVTAEYARQVVAAVGAHVAGVCINCPLNPKNKAPDYPLDSAVPGSGGEGAEEQ